MLVNYAFIWAYASFAAGLWVKLKGLRTFVVTQAGPPIRRFNSSENGLSLGICTGPDGSVINNNLFRRKEEQ